MAAEMDKMGKTEFLGKLSYELRDLPANEIADAIGYYQSYLNDAGPLGEADAIEHLGTPEIVAQRIRKNLGAPEKIQGYDPADGNIEMSTSESAGKAEDFGGSRNAGVGNATSFFDRNDAPDPEPRKNVNPYSSKNYYEQHGLQKPVHKQPEDTQAGSKQHKTATIIGILAIVLAIAWIPLLILLIVLGFTFAAIPTAIVMIVGALILFAKSR